MRFLTVVLIFIMSIQASELNSSTPQPSFSVWENIEFDYELDAYYTNVSWTFPLTDAEVKNYINKSELEVYYDLLLASIPPRFIVIELSYNPLPNLGVYLKEQQRSFYNSAVLFDVNLVNSITAGFDEPYALSLFFGNTVKFSESNETFKSGNRAYAGLLVSVSDGHIKDNVLLYDPSTEMEWKIIGHRSFDDYKLSWSYRIGMRHHQHAQIADSYYIGFRRSRLDFESSPLSILNNSAFEFKSTFKWGTVEPIGHYVLFAKKFPIELFGTKMGLNFGLGYIYQGYNKYSGKLKEEGVETHKLIIRPNIQF